MSKKNKENNSSEPKIIKIIEDAKLKEITENSEQENLEQEIEESEKEIKTDNFAQFIPQSTETNSRPSPVLLPSEQFQEIRELEEDILETPTGKKDKGIDYAQRQEDYNSGQYQVLSQGEQEIKQESFEGVRIAPTISSSQESHAFNFSNPEIRRLRQGAETHREDYKYRRPEIKKTKRRKLPFE